MSAYIGGAVPRHLKQQIELAARCNGRSISAECRDRLARSLESYPPEHYPPEMEAFTEMIGRIMVQTGEFVTMTNRLAGHSAPLNWADDPYAWNQALKAAHRVLERVADGLKELP